MRNTIVLEKDWTFYKNPQSESGEAVTLPHTWNAVDGLSLIHIYWWRKSYYEYVESV